MTTPHVSSVTALSVTFRHTPSSCAVHPDQGTPAGLVHAAAEHTVEGSSLASHRACRFSRRGCLAPDVSVDGVAAGAARWVHLVAEQTAEGYRWDTSFQRVVEFRDRLTGRTVRRFIRDCAGSYVRADQAVYAPLLPLRWES